MDLETPKDKLIPGMTDEWRRRVAARRAGVGRGLRPGLSPDKVPFDFPTPNSGCFSHSLRFRWRVTYLVSVADCPRWLEHVTIHGPFGWR